jgi:hypothetical protein
MPTTLSERPTLGSREGGNEDGCAYILGDPGGSALACGAPRGRNSSYCARHHELCYIGAGSRAERRRLRELEALANAAGGRRSRPSERPSDRALRRLERAARLFS